MIGLPLRDDDRLAMRRRRLVRHIHDAVAGGLREDRRGIAVDAEIERPRSHRLQHLRPGRMLAPLDPVAGPGQRLVEIPGMLEDDQRAIALVADAYGAAAGSLGLAHERSRKTGADGGRHDGAPWSQGSTGAAGHCIDPLVDTP